MKREIKNIIKTFILSIIFSVSISIFIAYATPPFSPYLPGETLDPSCSPGDPNCTVLPSLTGTSTPGNIGFYIGTTTLSGDTELFWDNINKRLGIGTSTPSEKLHVEGNLKIGGENNLLFISRGKRESNYGGPYDWYRGFIYLGKDLTPSDWYTDTLVPGVDSGYIVLGVDTDIGAFMPAVYDPNTLNYIRAANIEGASGVFQGDLYLQKSEGSSIFFKPGGNLVESSINFDDLNKKLSFIIKNPISTPFEFKTENPFTGNFLTIFNSSTNIFTLSSNGDIFSSGTLSVSTGTINNSLGIKTSNPLQPLHVEGNAYISGNLGIGISNPTNNLEVSGTSALFSSSGDFRITVSKGTAINTASILFQNNLSGRAEFGLTGDDKFHIKTSPDGSTWIEGLVVDSNGNVGIGTINPQTKLHIEGGEFWLFNNGNNPRIIIGDNGMTGQYGYLGWDSMNDYYRIETDGTNGLKIKGNYISIGNIYPSQPLIVGLGSTELFRVDSSGNVGIGTMAPTAKLHVKTTDLTTVPFQVEALVAPLAGWSYRRPITISNTGSSNLTDYQVLVTLDTQSLISAGKMRSDCGDIRFTDSDGSTLLNYWIESDCNTASTKIWVKVPSIPANSTKTIYVYYGNPSATSASNIKATFNNKGDDFDDNSLDTNIWSTSIPVGTISEVNQKLNINVPAASNANWWGTTLEYAPVASMVLPTGDFEARVRVESYTVITNSHPGVALWLDRNNVYFWGRLYDGSRNGLYVEKVVADSGTQNVCTSYITTLPIYLGIRRVGSSYDFIYSTDGNTWSTLCTISSLGFVPDKFGLHGKKWTTSAALDINFDNAYIRKYTSPEPTTSVGAEESAPPQQQTVFYIQNQTGNVGIGTTNPGYKLDVQGSIRQTNALNCALSADANGQIICTISSQRYKTNIQDLSFDINKFLALNPRSFDWNTSTINFVPGEKGSIGFIAEEVEKTFPELVRYKNGIPEGVKYEILPVYLFKIVKDLILGFTDKVKASLNELGIIIENGIAKIEKLFVREITINFAQIEKAEINELTSKKLCLEGDDGETVCLDKNQMKELLNRSGGSYTSVINNNQNSSNNNELNTNTTTNNSETNTNNGVESNPSSTTNTSTNEEDTASTNETNTNNPQESVSNQNQSVSKNTTSTTTSYQTSTVNDNQSSSTESAISSNESQP